MDFEPIERLTEEQVGQLHRLYQGEWWTRGRSLEDVCRMLEHTDLTLGLREKATGRLAAFARVLTDRVYKAFIFDVIVDPAYRGRGLGIRIMESVLGHPDLARVRHLELYCHREMFPFYRRWGFTEDVGETILMRRTTPPGWSSPKDE